MGGSFRKLVTIFAVLAIAMVPVSVISSSTDNSAAETSVDYSKYYYNQLNEFSKTIYDTVLTMTPNETDKTFNVKEEWFDTSPSAKLINDQIEFAVKCAQKALIGDNDIEYSSWLNFNSSITYSMLSGNKIPKTIDISLEKYTFPNSVTPESAKMAIKNAIKTAEIDKNENLELTISSIHNYVVNTLIYPEPEHMNDPLIRSIWNAFCGDRTVVCEGYAKMFHALCDYYDIPCIIVTGNARGSLTKEPEGHMWTYVLMDDDRWYLVDATWDDQVELAHTYFLAGSETEGFSLKIKDSYNTGTLTECGFVLPELSKVRYNDPSQQYTVSLCMEKTSEVYDSKQVYINKTMSVPANPHKEGFKFVKWLNSANDTEWNFNSPIKNDTTLYAEWVATSEAVYDTVFDSNGGKESYASKQTNASEQIQIPEKEPTRDGFKFLGWNTDQGGDGIMFEPGSKISVAMDTELYAAWESTEETPISNIDSTIESAGTFLKNETVPGVSNIVLTIGVAAIILSLIAIVLIARKE